MTVERRFLNPASLGTPRNHHYTHVVTVRGGTTVWVSGQWSHDAAGNLVGAGDLAAQARQTYANVERALEAVGAAPADVVKVQIFIKGYNPRTDLEPVMQAHHETFPGTNTPASTLLGVQSLAREEMLIEVECVAVR
jgi:enamine deaminase RidA (YjgF/YER057c/UK114 family)